MTVFGKGGLFRVGVATLQGTQPAPLDFTLKPPKAPKRVVVNALHDVLARLTRKSRRSAINGVGDPLISV